MDRSCVSGGQWNGTRPITYSQEAQELLKSLMQESHLPNIQKRQIRKCLKNGFPLHLACVSTSSSPPPPPQKKTCASSSRGFPCKSQKRSMEQCRAGDSYVREKFRPGPTRDLEKEKQRFQRILEMGKDVPAVQLDQTPAHTEEAPQEKERYEEILEEIEERQHFLEDMASFGQEKHYVNIINTEISQRLRELKLHDRSNNQTLKGGTSERQTDETEEQQ